MEMGVANLYQLKDSQCLQKYKNNTHAQAFGAAIRNDKLDEFINYSNRALANYEFSSTYRVDFIYDRTSLDPEDILGIAESKELWGHGVEEPLIVVTNVEITLNNSVA